MALLAKRFKSFVRKSKNFEGQKQMKATEEKIFSKHKEESKEQANLCLMADIQSEEEEVIISELKYDKTQAI